MPTKLQYPVGMTAPVRLYRDSAPSSMMFELPAPAVNTLLSGDMLVSVMLVTSTTKKLSGTARPWKPCRPPAGLSLTPALNAHAAAAAASSVLWA